MSELRWREGRITPPYYITEGAAQPVIIVRMWVFLWHARTRDDRRKYFFRLTSAKRWAEERQGDARPLEQLTPLAPYRRERNDRP